MEDYGDIYFIDDPRNAVVLNRGPRPGQGGRPRVMTTVRPRGPSYSQQPQYAAPGYVPPGYVPPGYPAVQQYAPAPVAPPPYDWRPYTTGGAPIAYGEPTAQSTAASILGRLTTGEILEMAASVFAAMQSLPNEPDVGSDEPNTGDLVKYQSALAQHAKRDEQIRTVASLARKLLG